MQVLQDMGLPTGVELKTAEPVKSEEAVVAATVEELRPVVTPIETATAATGAANADSTDAVEVQSCTLVSANDDFVQLVVFCAYFISLLSDCSSTGTNPN